MLSPFPANSILPLEVDEVINFSRKRWGVTYDFQLVRRSSRLYLQLMWAYLEQQSFPMDESVYRIHLNEVIEIVNRLGKAGAVREWLLGINTKPRIGKAISLPLKAEGLLKEFVV